MTNSLEVQLLVQGLVAHSRRLREIEEETERGMLEEVEKVPEEERELLRAAAREAMKDIYASTEAVWKSSIEFSKKIHNPAVVEAALEEVRKQVG